MVTDSHMVRTLRLHICGWHLPLAAYARQDGIERVTEIGHVLPLGQQVSGVAVKDGGDAKQVAVPDVSSTHLDALVGRPRDVGREKDLFLA